MARCCTLTLVQLWAVRSCGQGAALIQGREYGEKVGGLESDGFGVLMQMVIKGLELMRALRTDEVEHCGFGRG